jgi:hypothetical protein
MKRAMDITSLKRFARGFAGSAFDQLQFRYRVAVTGAFLVAMLLTSPLWFVAAFGLATVFGLDASPIRDQKGGWLWFTCFMLIVMVLISAAWLMGLSALAYLAHCRGELSGDEAVALALYAQYPRRWLMDQPEVPNNGA